MPFTLPQIIVALAAINLLAFATYWLDKAQARNGGWRVRESTLLWQAALGGSIGAWLACTVLRHKTRKQPFNSLLVGITFVQMLGAGLWIGWNAV